MDKAAKPAVTRDELLARWAAAEQAPAEEIRKADEWVDTVFAGLDDEHKARPAA